MRNGSENQIKLVFIRHGDTKSNKEHRYLGKTEEILCEDGIKELKQIRDEKYYPKITHLFSSPMKRCLETAQILYPDKIPVIIPEWEEMDFGAFEGKNYMELQGDKRYQAWIDSNGTLPFPEGESREEFAIRCERGFYRMLAMLSESLKKNQNSLIVAGVIVHGGTIMSLLSQYCGGEYFDYQVPNGSGYVGTLKVSEFSVGTVKGDTFKNGNAGLEIVDIEKIEKI